LKNNLGPLYSSSFIFFSFLVCFEWFKTWWVCQLGFYKTFFNSKDKDALIKEIKLEILICYNSFITKHWTLLHQTPHVFPHSFIESSNFCSLESVRWRATNVLWTSQVNEQFVKIWPHLSSYMFAHWPIYPN